MLYELSGRIFLCITRELVTELSPIFTAPDGTIIGEFGFATANGLYLTTKYATDKNGNFIVRERTKETLGERMHVYADERTS